MSTPKNPCAAHECCWPTTTWRRREQLRELLEPEFDVVALVEDGRALVSAAARLSPDVIVADISMPGLDGIDASVLIRRSDPEARIVLVTVHSESDPGGSAAWRPVRSDTC